MKTENLNSDQADVMGCKKGAAVIELLNVDCIEYMKTCKDKSFDLAICDPPYGIGRDGLNNSRKGNGKGRKGFEFKGWDDNIPSEEYFAELFRVSKNQIIWGANYMTKYLPPSMGWIFWDKGQRIQQSDGELAYTSFERALKVAEYGRHELAIDQTIHPTQKPVKLYNWILENYAEAGNKILDTHLGSGSIAIACHYRGFDLVGCEIDTGYYNDALKRFKTKTAQMKLL